MIDDLARELAEAAHDAFPPTLHGPDVDELAAVLKTRALTWLGRQPMAARLLAWKAGLTDRVSK